MNVLDHLSDPPSDYRPIPFWSWNDSLDRTELLRQVTLMHEAGMGGFFMHARGGLKTQYMGDEWFSLIEDVITHAKALGMAVWAYDENGWPSGMGDGKIPCLKKEYCQKSLYCRTVPGEEAGTMGNCLGIYSLDGKAVSAGDAAGHEVIVVFYRENPYYVDLTNAEVTEVFLRKVHQQYYDRLSPRGRNALAGFFTDEPQLARMTIPYSPSAFDLYEKDWGENLQELLPQLFLEIGNYQRTRRRFWHTLNRCFTEIFIYKVSAWCHAHNWRLTGHMISEETYTSQQNGNGGSVMPHYPAFDIPGMDWLGRKTKPVTTALQTWSVCAQTGKKQMLIEGFAGCGWNVSFRELKYILNSQMVRGANLLCNHLESYSLQGIRKRDYPASLFYHQPWWKYFRAFTDWASRVGMLLAEGEDTTSVLVIHGIATSHILWDEIPEERRKKCNAAGEHPVQLYWNSLHVLCEELEQRQCMFHFGDEILMEKIGSVSSAGLVVGKMTYRGVVLPQVSSLDPSTIQLLTEFSSHGFPVFGIRNRFSDTLRIDGKPCHWDKLPFPVQWFDTEAEAAGSVAACFASVSVTGRQKSHVIHTERRYPADKMTFHYFVNSELNEDASIRVKFPGRSVRRLDPETGLLSDFPYENHDGMISTDIRLPGGGEALLLAFDFPQKLSPPEQMQKTRILQLPKKMKLAEMPENYLVIDRCDCYVDGQLLCEDEYVLSVQSLLLALHRDVQIRLVFRFTADETADLRNLSLLVEQSNLYQIKVNGIEISNHSDHWVFDKAFHKLSLGNGCRSGCNEIELIGLFHQTESLYRDLDKAVSFEAVRNKITFESEIESIAIAGKFAVSTTPELFTEVPEASVRYKGNFVIGPQGTEVTLKEIERSGFPFFCGTMALEYEFEAHSGEMIEVKFTRQLCTVCEILLNGKGGGKLFWGDPSMVLPAEWIEEGRNKITLRLTNSLRNLLGPHHIEPAEPRFVMPKSFYKDPSIFSAVGNDQWNNHWCFSRFGMEI